MAFLIRSVLLFASVAFSDAMVDQTACSINGARALDELIDSAVFMWASVDRCQKKGHMLQCEMDVAQTLESVAGTANFVVNALRDCAGINTTECGKKAGVLAQASAGLAAAVGGIVDRCVNSNTSQVGISARPGEGWIHCFVDAKGALRSLLEAWPAVSEARASCTAKTDKMVCLDAALSVVGALGGLGQFGAGAIGTCKQLKSLGGTNSKSVACASHISQAIHHASWFSKAAIAMSKECGNTQKVLVLQKQRLYEIQKDSAEGVSSGNSETCGGLVCSLRQSSVTMALGALLPVTALVGFVGGSRFAKHRHKQHEGPLVSDDDSEAPSTLE